MSRTARAALVVAAALLGAGCRCGDEPASAERGVVRTAYRCSGCNVILISIDTLRADHLGCYGYPRETSPNIDRLARESLVFDDAISQSSWTTPAHASIFSGLTPDRHGLVYFRDPGRLDDELVTMPETLAEAGYRTVGFTGGGYVSGDFGLGQGFEVYESRSRRFAPNLAAARAWLEEWDAEEPFFMFLHGYDVHRPYDSSRFNTFVERVEGFEIEEFCTAPETRRHPGDEILRYVVAQYDAGIVEVDRLLGRFFEYLERRGLMDETVLVITSDHGDEFFEHGGCDHKHSVYRELIHVPLIVRLPGGVVGRVAPTVPASVGMPATIAGIVGIGDAPGGQELDLLRVARRGRYEGPPVESETGRHLSVLQHWKGVIAGDWKLIYSRDDTRDSRPRRFELYHREEDPGERSDVLDSNPRVVDEMKGLLFRPGEPVLEPEKPAAGTLTENPDLLEQLKSLGYLGK
ncbi:MAG: sulfatase [Polyangia bacterium]